MNFGKYTIDELENETIININLNENENIIFHKRENNHIKIGDKMCTIVSKEEKNPILSSLIRFIKFLLSQLSFSNVYYHIIHSKC